MSEKYFILEKGDVQIHLFADTDLDDVILNRQELYKVLKRLALGLEKPQLRLLMKASLRHELMEVVSERSDKKQSSRGSIAVLH